MLVCSSTYSMTLAKSEKCPGLCIRQLNVVDLSTHTHKYRLAIWRYEGGWHLWCLTWGHGLFSSFLLANHPDWKGESKIRPFVWLDNVQLILPWVTQYVCVCVFHIVKAVTISRKSRFIFVTVEYRRFWQRSTRDKQKLKCKHFFLIEPLITYFNQLFLGQ